jgi:proteasome activator subunit 4
MSLPLRFPLSLSHCVSLTVSLTVSPAVSPQLMSKCQLAIEIPVGGSMASSPISRRPPRECLMLFSVECLPRARSASKLIVYLLSATGAGGTMEYLSTLTGIFENYYHPSNGGAWSNSLTYFLRHLTGYLKKRLVAEEEFRRGVSWAPVNAWGGALVQAQRTAVATLILRMCRNAHFSKTQVLSQAATAAMGALAYVEPTLALPVVASHFEQALSTVTATHQLVASLDALAVCVRPLLLFHTPLDDLPVDVMVAQALMSTLPGLDANDPAKTLSTLKLYTSVLSSVHRVCDPSEVCEEHPLVCLSPKAIRGPQDLRALKGEPLTGDGCLFPKMTWLIL